MNKQINWLQFLIGWRFLPERLQGWLFGTATRAVECVSALGLIGFALVFAFDDDLLHKYPIYAKFKELPEWGIVSSLLLIGLLQLWAMAYRSRRSNILSGYMLLLASGAWFMIFIAFSASYPPANTGMVLPSVLSFVCGLAGKNLIDFTRRKISVNNELKNRKGA